MGDDLPPDLTRSLIRRLTAHGPLAEGSTAGALNAALSDLAQRLHWAMGTDMDYPAAMPHRTTYQLSIPAASVPACVADLWEAGAEEVQDGPADPLDARTVTATFPELAPDPAYRERIAQLTTLAEHHGGQFAGATW